MGLANYYGKELYVDTNKLNNVANLAYQASFTRLKNMLNDIHDKICSLQGEVAATSDWVGNGREECAMVLMVLAQYCESLGGATGVKCVSDISADISLDCYSNATNIEHLQELITIINEFKDNAETFQQTSTGIKSANILDLESII